MLPEPGSVLTWCQTIGLASPGVDSTIISILGMKRAEEIGYSVQTGFRRRSCSWGKQTAAWREAGRMEDVFEK